MDTRLRLGLFIAVIVCGMGTAAPASSQSGQNQCAVCHEANTGLADFEHLLEWEESVHRREGIGCQTCHGGDSTSSDPSQAHRGVLSSRNPASPVHPSNLPATCGTCHEGPLKAFRESQHSALLSAGDWSGPTCRTCHGTVGARLPPPARLELECQACHAADGTAPRPEYPRRGRVMLERIIEARQVLNSLRRSIGRVDDVTRRLALEEARALTEGFLDRAVEASHRFVFAEAEAQLLEAQRRSERLEILLVNSD